MMNLNLDEAIQHCLEVAERKKESIAEYEQNPIHYEKEIRYCKECASEHRQLAEWLRELKAYRKILANADRIIESEYGCVIIEGYKDVIDQMNEVFREVIADEDSD